MDQTSSRFVPHASPVADSLAAFNTTAQGLCQTEAQQRLKQHGPNRLPEPPRRNAVLRLLSHFHNVLTYVLLGAAVTTAALGHVVDTGVVLAVVIANAVIGFIQEGRA